MLPLVVSRDCVGLCLALIITIPPSVERELLLCWVRFREQHNGKARKVRDEFATIALSAMQLQIDRRSTNDRIEKKTTKRLGL